MGRWGDEIFIHVRGFAKALRYQQLRHQAHKPLISCKDETSKNHGILSKESKHREGA